MLLGFKRRFAPFVEEGSKTHTIRALRKIPARVGETCHCYVDPRQKTMRLLGRWRCVRIESIELRALHVGEGWIYKNAPPLSISIEGQTLRYDELLSFLHRDGFRSSNFATSAHEAFAFWKDRLPFAGQVIHWAYQPKASAEDGSNYGNYILDSREGISYYKGMENTLRLTNGNETFLLSQIVSDNLGPVHAKDCRGAGYSRCEAACDHEFAPAKATVWHDDEHTEELWEVK